MKRFKAANGTVRLRIGKLMPWVAIVFASALLTACASTQPEAFSGTVFNKVEPAFDFQLQDQFGNLIRLTDHKDKVVVLTFLYTNCEDVCPIVTTQLKETFQELSDVVEEVEFLAVSVDPESDTASEAYDFLNRWGLVNDWSYLVGTEDRLEPIWKAYFVDPAIDDSDPLQISDGTTSAPQTTGATDSLGRQIGDSYRVIHSTPVYLIDRKGQRRVVFTSPLNPSEVTHDVRLLLGD